MGDSDTQDMAKRLKEVILANGGYQKISESSGISCSTLVRAAAGKTDPKFKDVLNICFHTKSTLNYIAYGIKDKTELEQQIHQFKEEMDSHMKDFDMKIAKLEQVLHDANILPTL